MWVLEEHEIERGKRFAAMELGSESCWREKVKKHPLALSASALPLHLWMAKVHTTG